MNPNPSIKEQIQNVLTKFADDAIDWEVMGKDDYLTLDQATEAIKKIMDEYGDGYHTFEELYDYRRVYNAALFNEWALQDKYSIHKSWKHSDGEDCFGGGWFVVMAELPTGQVSNHYEAKYWDDFAIPERELAETYDGHTPAQALGRLDALRESQRTKLRGEK